jgi:NADPH:quinone reductase-like Zn-dependent oxidoreductase
MVVPKPANVTFEQAAAVPTSAVTALQGLRASGLAAGQSILVIGAGGGVGIFAVQLAASLGAEITGVCSGAKAELVRSLGADHVIDYTRDDFATQDRRYDVILDTAGNRPLRVLRRALAPKGTLVLVGGENGGRLVAGFDRQLRALALSPFVSQRLTGLAAVVRREDLIRLSELLAAGSIVPVIDRAYPLADAVAAFRLLESGKAQGKIVIAG